MSLPTVKSRFSFLAWTLFAGLVCLPSAWAATRVTVTGTDVVLRAGPDQGDLVYRHPQGHAKVSKGDSLVVVGDPEGDWVQIMPPESVDLWVYSDLVRDGVVTVARLRVRSGPGISYKEVGVLSKGARLTVRGKVGDWLRVAPPNGTRLWISGKYIQKVVAAPAKVKPAKTQAVVVKKPPAAVKKPPRPAPLQIPAPKRPVAVVHPGKSAPAAPVVIPGILSGKKLVSSAEQGREVAYVGVLRPAGFVWRRPSKFRLIKTDRKGHAVTVCYLAGDETQLRSMDGKTLSVFGREFWVQGVRYPVVVPDKILRKD